MVRSPGKSSSPGSFLDVAAGRRSVWFRIGYMLGIGLGLGIRAVHTAIVR